MRVFNIVRAGPNFVKIAPLIREMRRCPSIVPILVHAGQHYDQGISEQFFTNLDIGPPGFNLGVGSGSHAVQTAEVGTPGAGWGAIPARSFRFMWRSRRWFEARLRPRVPHLGPEGRGARPPTPQHPLFRLEEEAGGPPQRP